MKKNCPKCRVESRSDAEWCWHCGYSYEEAEDRQANVPEEQGQTAPDTQSGDSG